MVVPELLEVGKVARPGPVAQRHDQSGPVGASRPTRDDAWMYSAVFFGCPTTSISPSRWTSTPTWSIEVASTTSNGSSLRAAPSCRPSGRPSDARIACSCRSRDRTRGPSRSSVSPISAEAIRDVSSPMWRLPESCRIGGGSRSPAGPLDPGRDVVHHVAGHAGELPGRVEVADERHVGVGGRAGLVEQQLACRQQHLGDPDLCVVNRMPWAQTPK